MKISPRILDQLTEQAKEFEETGECKPITVGKITLPKKGEGKE